MRDFLTFLAFLAFTFAVAGLMASLAVFPLDFIVGGLIGTLISTGYQIPKKSI